MALNRRDACQHAAKENIFVSCIMFYDATYNGQKTMFRIQIAASDLPGNANPTDQQVQVVADPRAIAAYDAWKTQIDVATSAMTSHHGQAGQIAS